MAMERDAEKELTTSPFSMLRSKCLLTRGSTEDMSSSSETSGKTLALFLDACNSTMHCSLPPGLLPRISSLGAMSAVFEKFGNSQKTRRAQKAWLKAWTKSIHPITSKAQ